MHIYIYIYVYIYICVCVCERVCVCCVCVCVYIDRCMYISIISNICVFLKSKDKRLYSHSLNFQVVQIRG